MVGMRVTLVITMGLVFASISCVRPNPRAVPLIPEASTAREALDLALRSWVQGGPKTQTIGEVIVQHVDRRRAEGDQPIAYQITGAVREDWARGFVVRLTWPDQAEPETVTYLVAGGDPIWIMRREEIDLLLH